VAELAEAARRPRRTFDQARAALGSLIAARGFLKPVSSSLTGTVGPHRRWSWASADLADVKRIRKDLGGTINDVVLAAIARGFRDLIVARGESVVDRNVRTMVPVSVRSSDQHGEYNNRVSAIFADLPVGIDDVQVALLDIHAQMADLKSSEKAVAGEVLTSLGGFAPSMLLALGARAVARAPQLTFETCTTNVPGPQNALYATGRRMVASYPYIPIASPVRIVVGIFSYDGQLTFGVTGDYDSAPDIDVLCAGIEAGIAEMLTETTAAAA
jgi:WS/DGAT/MGAT family acyltransferase